MTVTTLELFRRRERVRRAATLVERDKRRVAAAYDDFLAHKVARPATLAAFALAGFAFGLWHFRRRNARKGLGLSAIATAFFWTSRLFGRHGPYDLTAGDPGRNGRGQTDEQAADTGAAAAGE